MKRSIFYLDDEASQLEVFQELFRAEFDVRTSTAPDEARHMLAHCAADIIISDQKMPQIKGTDFLRETMNACPASFRILMTGTVGIGEMMNEVRVGIIHAFLAKPWTEAKMEEVLARACAFLDRQGD